MNEHRLRKAKPVGPTVKRDHGRLKVMDNGGRYWTDEAETRFLDALSVSANVTWSAGEAGFSSVAVYRRRRGDTAFANRWQAALEQGVARLQMALVRAAADSMEGIEFDADRPMPPMTYDQAANILKLHSNAVGQPGRRYGRFAAPRSMDDIRDGILRKVEAIIAARDSA